MAIRLGTIVVLLGSFMLACAPTVDNDAVHESGPAACERSIMDIHIVEQDAEVVQLQMAWLSGRHAATDLLRLVIEDQNGQTVQCDTPIVSMLSGGATVTCVIELDKVKHLRDREQIKCYWTGRSYNFDEHRCIRW